MKTLPYRNPVVPGFHPDPSVCRVGPDFYLVVSSFEFFPGLPVFHSTNLVNWEPISFAWHRESQFDMAGAGASRGLFAPTIRFHAGEFFITVTDVSGTGNCILRSGTPYGPWSDPVPVAQGGIDPSLFFDDDGTAFFCTNAEVDGSTGIALSVINPVTGALRSPVRHICAGTGGRWPEAPHLYKFDGLYYLMLAEGGTEYGHMETLFRSESPWGPYTPCPTNPVLSHRDAVSNPVQCTGHADIVDDGAGNLWAVFLGVRTLPGVLLHNLGRETFLSPVVQDAAGWFSIGNGGIVGLEMEGPLPGEARPYTRDWKPSYIEGKRDPHWCFVRGFDASLIHFDCTDAAVRLAFGPDISTPSGLYALALRRQEGFLCEFSARVEFPARIYAADENSGKNSGVRAGLTAYYNDSYHYDIFVYRDGVCGTNDPWRLGVSKRIHDMEAVVASVDLPESLLQVGGSGLAAVDFRIRSDTEWYVFEWKAGGTGWAELGRGKTAGLCTEGTYHMSFTGVLFGVFASGCLNFFGSEPDYPVSFSDCAYTERD
ncbi:MAG: glycoside hydrolase family 43 protein [Treponema sp.]|nr:MAG: glycoside hydrolase family 43 protein [Treponema sp.]